MLNKFEPTGKRLWEILSSPESHSKGYASYEEFYDALKKSIEVMDHADDAGTVDSMMGQWQEWCASWKPIFDEHGGI